MSPSRPPSGRTGHRKDLRPAPARLGLAAPLDHATSVIGRVCFLAGSAQLLDDRAEHDRAAGLRSAIAAGDTPALFDRLAEAFSLQGVSDRAALTYMAQHGRVTWQDIAGSVAGGCSCPRLNNYWTFQGCRYRKTINTCAEPRHLRRCPLPRHDLRNGRLNQTAYSLYLFIRDGAALDLIGWIDAQLRQAAHVAGADRMRAMREALVGPMRHIFGVSDKVLTMALSDILLAAPRSRPLWLEAGTAMIAVDTLVHNFLDRTGILGRFGTRHRYGERCYRPNGCADIIEAVAARIDASRFSPNYPAMCPRFVQHAIWRFCAQQELNVCNGNRIDDRSRCQNADCAVFQLCDRVHLRR